MPRPYEVIHSGFENVTGEEGVTDGDKGMDLALSNIAINSDGTDI